MSISKFPILAEIMLAEYFGFISVPAFNSPDQKTLVFRLGLVVNQNCPPQLEIALPRIFAIRLNGVARYVGA
ncbi:hypothetical protein CCR95_14950 [Thiocystis minor]|nr:hypothetical protein [Thiocystis minor]